MSISIKSIFGGSNNEPPNITNLKSIDSTSSTITISYNVEDKENTIIRHYITVKNNEETIMNHVEITEDVGINKKEFNYCIKNLKIGKSYTIQIFCSDGNDESNSEAIVSNTSSVTIFGVSVNESNSNPENCCTYTNNAIGVSPATQTTLGGWVDKYPFNKIRIVGFKGGEVVKEIKKEDKTQYIDGTSVTQDVDVMVEIPKVYWSFAKTSTGYEVKISNIKVDSTYDCYAHKVNGIEKDYIYVGAYLGCVKENKLRSISNMPVRVNVTLNDAREYAQANGKGYQQNNWFVLILLQILYLILYKNLDSQSALGTGWTAFGSPCNTGGTNKKGIVFGGTQTNQICFLGVEDLYGNVYEWIDGIKVDSTYNTLITSDNKNFTNSYKNIGKFIESTRGGKMSKSIHTNEGGFFPTETTGSNSTYYCDHSSIGSDKIARFGGHYNENMDVGIFCIKFDYGPSGSNAQIGTRLVFL